MNWQLNPYAVALIGSALISAAIAVRAWHHRDITGSMSFIMLMAGITVWSFGYAMATGTRDLEGRVFWAQVQYLGMFIVPIAFPIFVFQYTGFEKWVTRRNVVLLSVVPLTTLILVWTNASHGLIWAKIELVPKPDISLLNLQYGLFFWVHYADYYVVLALCAILLLRTMFRSPGLPRNQAAIILLGGFFPWLGNALYMLRLAPFPDLDLTSFGYCLSGLIASWGLFRYHFMDIVPVARDKVVDNMRDGVIVLDARSRVADINPAAQDLLGRTGTELIGQTVDQVLRLYPDLVSACHATVEKQVSITWEQGETARYFDARTLPLLGRRSQITGWLIVLHDVTERWLAEFRQAAAMEELRRAKDAAEVANRAKSVFLAHMSHELRTPLTAILGFTDLMIHDLNLTPVQRKNLGIVGRSGEHLLTLINDILELSKIETGRAELHVKEFELHQLLQDVEEVFRLQAEGKGLAWVMECDPKLPSHIRADQGRLRQVLVNLLGNAVKFTELGQITLRVGMGATPEILYVQVQDTGIGIAPEEQETIFDAFVQLTHGRQLPPGSGLGLALSHQFVRLMGGDLRVRSQIGEGSCFSFDVPVQVIEPPRVSTTEPVGVAPPEIVGDAISTEGLVSEEDLIGVLAQLPAERLADLHQAAVQGDLDWLMRLISYIETGHAGEHALLLSAVSNFQLAQVLHWVEQAEIKARDDLRSEKADHYGQ